MTTPLLAQVCDNAYYHSVEKGRCLLCDSTSGLGLVVAVALFLSALVVSVVVFATCAPKFCHKAATTVALAASAPEGNENDKRTEGIEDMFKDGEAKAAQESDKKRESWLASLRTKFKLTTSLFQILNQARAFRVLEISSDIC